MTSRERLSRAMARGIPDRVPVMCQMSIGHILLQAGGSPCELWNSGPLFTEALLRLRSQYGFDGILVSLHGHRPDWPTEVRIISRNADGEVVDWKNGDRTVFPFDDLPRHQPASPKPTPDLSRFDPASTPDVIDHIPVSQGLDFILDPASLFDIFDTFGERGERSFSLHGEVTSPFDYFLHLFGFQQAITGLVEDPGRCRHILDILTEGVCRIAAGMADHGADAVKISSPFAGAGFIPPQFYSDFVAPYEGRIVRQLRGSGTFTYLHTCGAVNDRLEMMTETGADGIECLDPPPLGDVRLAEAKARIGSRVFIKGNVDPVHVLLSGNRRQILSETKSCLRAGMPGGGYILSTACSIAPHTPSRNIVLLVEAAERWGWY